MSRFYSFNYLNKEIGCACDLRDFLPNEKQQKYRKQNLRSSKKILRKGGKNENQRNNRKMAIY